MGGDSERSDDLALYPVGMPDRAARFPSLGSPAARARQAKLAARPSRLGASFLLPFPFHSNLPHHKSRKSFPTFVLRLPFLPSFLLTSPAPPRAPKPSLLRPTASGLQTNDEGRSFRHPPPPLAIGTRSLLSPRTRARPPRPRSSPAHSARLDRKRRDFDHAPSPQLSG